MRAWPLLLFLLLLPVQAQPDEVTPVGAPELVVLFHHPFPDAADPLGFDAGPGRDAYVTRYAHLDAEQDGFDYPHMVLDGTIAVEGLPDPAAPYASVDAAYQAAFVQRRGLDAAVALRVSGAPTGFDVQVRPQGDLSGTSLGVFAAMVEDHVFYDGGRLGNGVTDHRFVVRDLQRLGGFAGMSPAEYHVSMEPRADAPLDQMYIAVWIQQGAVEGPRFAAHEVVQATLHPWLRAETVQMEKAALMEVYSATWCDPCLFGDRVAEEMAVEYGIATEAPAQQARYLRVPERPLLLALAGIAAGVAVAWTRWPRGPA